MVDGEYHGEGFKHVTTVTMELMSAHDSSILTDIVPKELRIECDGLLSKFEPVTAPEFDEWCLASMQTFEVVEGLPNVATSLGTAISFLRDRLGNGCMSLERPLDI